MRLSILAAAAFAASSAQAFRDTSPFVMFSTSSLPESSTKVSTSQLQSKSVVLQTAKDFLKTCPSEIYYFITQPFVSSSELSTAAHHLKMAVGNPAVKARYLVSEVAGLQEGDADGLMKFIEETCGAAVVEAGKSVDDAFKARSEGGVVVKVGLEGLAGVGEERKEVLEAHDSALYTTVLKDLPKGYRYTVIFTTTPASGVVSSDSKHVITYDPEFMEAFHMDLKRNFYTSKRENETNSTDFRPLFEKYEYFNPGLFMGLTVSLLLLAILSVGISAVSSLEVSYGAFDKEMGPAAQKKQ